MHRDSFAFYLYVNGVWLVAAGPVPGLEAMAADDN